MNYFAIQVRTTGEDDFIARAESRLVKRLSRQRFFFPKRRLIIRRQGKTHPELKPVFPGYIFLEIDGADLDRELFAAVRRTPNFYRILRSNQERTPLAGRDLAVLRHFVSFGDIAEASKVFFDESDRIVVTEGPLLGLEGSIIKVDKRKKRAKVRLNFSNEDFLLDLAFEVLEKAGEASGALPYSAKPDERVF
jgi:transcriptional antiterminator NusG